MSGILKLQLTLPEPVPVESFSVVAKADCKSVSVWNGRTNGLTDHTAESRFTATVWVSLRSASVKLSVPGADVSGVDDPVALGCSATVPDSAPLVIVTGS